ncbi:uncharacterized protein PODANS_2_6265 [Podospora anserina S mat+]|uniref:Podospora anserina S mat+ genomic DNA chromosome 2, supercontig 2 n=1 Tax=Podospora anserina (strain S / ATCC MYA-4624 / DSM 980 / FGSC 10383) TaxID=515849 RepID=B2B5Z5_PODAN|nr:uncharacterized protein PODANS_2_6265 [Podospora anserina S mat+]CAP73220.1 unnamed protein product [Podospora anserina S mat+]CDP25621.1 Putative protein of unknown function [Podospora anserina S mat+]
MMLWILLFPTPLLGLAFAQPSLEERSCSEQAYLHSADCTELIAEYAGNYTSEYVTLEPGHCDIKMPKLCEGFFCNVSPNKVSIIKKDKLIDSLLNFTCHVESALAATWVNDDKENPLNFTFMYWDPDFTPPAVLHPRDDPPKLPPNVLCFELGFKPAFAQWTEDCQSVFDTLASQYTTNYTFNSPKDYIWIMNEKCSAILYQSAFNKSIPIPDVPMQTVVSWTKDYIFDHCINTNKSGAVWGVGDNTTFPFGGLKTEFLPSSIAVRTWWEIMGWHSHAELPSGANDSIVAANLSSRSSSESKVARRSVSSGCFNATELIKNIFDSVTGFTPSFLGNITFPTAPIVQDDCQEAINMLQDGYINEDGGRVYNFTDLTPSMRFLYNSCVLAIWNTSPNTTVPNVDMTTVSKYAQDHIFNECISKDLSGLWNGIGEDAGSSLRTLLMPMRYFELMRGINQEGGFLPLITISDPQICEILEGFED